MIIILFILGVCFGFYILAYADWSLGSSEGFFWATVGSLFIIGLGIILPIHSSYETYLDARTTYDRIQNDYKEAIEVYEDKAVINADSLTDFRYEGYQESIASLIKDLREKTVEYNEVVIKKRLMGNNIFFSWYIVGPDEDMKLLKIKE